MSDELTEIKAGKLYFQPPPNSLFRVNGLDGGFVEMLTTGELVVKETENFKINDAAKQFFNVIEKMAKYIMNNKQFEYVPSEGPAMTSILWRDIREFEPKNAPMLLKMRCGRIEYYDTVNTESEAMYFLEQAHMREALIAWTPLPKLEE